VPRDPYLKHYSFISNAQVRQSGEEANHCWLLEKKKNWALCYIQPTHLYAPTYITNMQIARDKNYGYNVICSLELFISLLAELHTYTKYESSAMKQHESYSNQYGL
jgi:hypothetical protein